MAKKKWLHKILAILPSISLIVILLIKPAGILGKNTGEKV